MPGWTVDQLASHYMVPPIQVRAAVGTAIRRRWLVIDQSGRIFPGPNTPYRPSATSDKHGGAASSHSLAENSRVVTKALKEAHDRFGATDWRSVLEDRDFLRRLLDLIDRAAHTSISPELRQCADAMASVARSVLERDQKSFSTSIVWFKWPEVGAFDAAGFSGKIEIDSHGLLSSVGYHVGQTAPDAPERRRFLDQAFTATLPDRSMGSPSTCRRLHAMAYSIVFSIRQARRKTDKDYSVAIDHWTADLAWLKARHYDGKCGTFIWPNP
ncbi:MAG: hypothetical protein IH626_04660 [Rhodospirillales bacterium]|nr:hypothetical protein [Rhodospirillales bacterium]